MILQVDHVALSSLDFDKDLAFWKELNYNLIFLESSIQNLEIKIPFLKEFHEAHDLALIANQDNYSIELLNHHHLNENQAYIFPIFENIPIQFIETERRKTFFCDLKVTSAELKETNIPCYFFGESNQSPFRFNKIVMNVNNFDDSLAFWQRLGFRILKRDNLSAILLFQSLFSRSDLEIVLTQSMNESNYFLDDIGWNCIALVSNSAKKEEEYLKNSGYPLTTIQELEVNAKCLQIFFVKGPSNELVEIISPKS
jgi:hypothetical protein